MEFLVEFRRIVPWAAGAFTGSDLNGHLPTGDRGVTYETYLVE